MIDNDSNIIKPVEGLHNIAGLTPVKSREDRKRRQQFNQAKEQNSDAEGHTNNATDEKKLPVDITENEDEQSASGGVDYCA